jgi:DNA-directed RNA polymerase specialized sigma24 family protein
LTHQEASEMLGVPLGTVLSRVSRARSRLRELLTPTQEEPVKSNPLRKRS